MMIQLAVGSLESWRQSNQLAVSSAAGDVSLTNKTYLIQLEVKLKSGSVVTLKNLILYY